MLVDGVAGCQYRSEVIPAWHCGLFACKGAFLMTRLNIFTGYYGSGKTEIAINYALQLAKQNPRVCVVDLDIVNPYFCSRDVRDDLEAAGIRMISSNPAFSNVELGVVSPEVMAVFNDKNQEVVIDVGGDDLGALALGQFNRYFQMESYEVNLVINTHRPDTATEGDVKDCLTRIQGASRLKVTHLIANTNLSYETTVADVLEGDTFVAELADKWGIPHRFTVCRRDLSAEVTQSARGEVFPIDIFMKPPWM